MAYTKLSQFPTDEAIVADARKDYANLPLEDIVDACIDIQIAVAKALAWAKHLQAKGDPAGFIIATMVDEIHYEAIRLSSERDVFENHIRKPGR